MRIKRPSRIKISDEEEGIHTEELKSPDPYLSTNTFNIEEFRESISRLNRDTRNEIVAANQTEATNSNTSLRSEIETEGYNAILEVLVSGDSQL